MSVNIGEMLGGGLRRMSHVHRYSSVPAIRKENVAEHTFYVAFYSYLIGKDLESKGVKVNFGEMLSRALLHDIDESMTGDFLRHVKYGHPDLKKALDEVSISMLNKMSDKLGVNLLPQWLSAKFEDLEGEIIQVVDLAHVLSYVWEEIEMGNTHVSDIPKECAKYIQQFVDDNPDSKVTPYAERIIDWNVSKLLKSRGS